MSNWHRLHTETTKADFDEQYPLTSRGPVNTKSYLDLKASIRSESSQQRVPSHSRTAKLINNKLQTEKILSVYSSRESKPSNSQSIKGPNGFHTASR